MTRDNLRLFLSVVFFTGLVAIAIFGLEKFSENRIPKSFSAIFSGHSSEIILSGDAPTSDPETSLSPSPASDIPAPASILKLETASGSSISIEESSFPDRTCQITDYGAVKGGVVSNTDAFRKAIESCAESGGGTVLVPQGTWLTGAIKLKSNINLHLEKGATVLFSTNFDEYLPVVFSRFEGIEYYNYSAPIYAADAINVAITGEGTLDGQGSAWWSAMRQWDDAIKRLYQMGDNGVPVADRVFGTVKDSLRPSFIEFVNCRRVLVDSVQIRNGPMWTIHPLYSESIIIRNANISTNPGPSTDGIAVDSSSDVLIENNVLSTGDDAIVLKSGRNQDGLRVGRPTEQVLIRNNSILEAHAAVAIGSEMSGGVRNIFVENLSVNTVQYGFRVKSSVGRGGVVENIRAKDIHIGYASIEAIQFTTAYENSFIKNAGDVPIFRNIDIEDMNVQSSRRSIEIIGLSDQPITDTVFKNITIASKFGARIAEVKNISFDTLSAVPTKGAIFEIKNGSGIVFKNMKCPLVRKDCLVISGPNSQGIDIRDSSFSNSSVTISDDANPNALL